MQEKPIKTFSFKCRYCKKDEEIPVYQRDLKLMPYIAIHVSDKLCVKCSTEHERLEKEW